MKFTPPGPPAEPHTHAALADGAGVSLPLGTVGVRLPVGVHAVPGAEPGLQPLYLQQSRMCLLTRGEGVSSGCTCASGSAGTLQKPPGQPGGSTARPASRGAQAAAYSRCRERGAQRGPEDRLPWDRKQEPPRRERPARRLPNMGGRDQPPTPAAGLPGAPLPRPCCWRPTLTAAGRACLCTVEGPAAPQNPHLIYQSSGGASVPTPTEENGNNRVRPPNQVSAGGASAPIKDGAPRTDSHADLPRAPGG